MIPNCPIHFHLSRIAGITSLLFLHLCFAATKAVPCKKTKGMQDPQLVPDDAITVNGSVDEDLNNKPTNVRPNSGTPLKSKPNGKPLTVSTVIDPENPEEVGKIKPKTKNVDGIKVEVKRTPKGAFEPVKGTDVTKGSQPRKDGTFKPNKGIKFVEGTTVTEIRVTLLPKDETKPVEVQLQIHACFEKKTTG